MIITSLKKTLEILEVMGNGPQELSLSELSLKSGFSKSTIHHILSTLQCYGYVYQNPENRKYSLGFKFLTFGNVILKNLDIRTVANPYLVKLHEYCGEATNLVILRNGKVIYIDKIDSQGKLSLSTYIGFTTDPHASAGGKVLLSGLTDKEILKIYADKQLKKYVKNTITDLDILLKEINKIRKKGYAIDNEEYYEGVRCVAAPIRILGKTVAAISITGSIFTFTMQRINSELKDMIIETAEKVSSEINSFGNTPS